MMTKNGLRLALAEMRYAVYSGSENLDLGDKRVSVLCESESQARHMKIFWGEHGYYELIAHNEADSLIADSDALAAAQKRVAELEQAYAELEDGYALTDPGRITELEYYAKLTDEHREQLTKERNTAQFAARHHAEAQAVTAVHLAQAQQRIAELEKALGSIDRTADEEYIASGKVIATLRAEVARLRDAIAAESREIEQALGRALGYPRYCDDQVNFPGSTDADGVCVGEHVPASLAMEAARAIREGRTEVARLRKLILREHTPTCLNSSYREDDQCDLCRAAQQSEENSGANRDK